MSFLFFSYAKISTLSTAAQSTNAALRAHARAASLAPPVVVDRVGSPDPVGEKVVEEEGEEEEEVGRGVGRREEEKTRR